MLLTCHAVGERKRLQDELAHQATHDALTGLPNRTELSARLDTLLAGDRPARPVRLPLRRSRRVQARQRHAGPRRRRPRAARRRRAARQGRRVHRARVPSRRRRVRRAHRRRRTRTDALAVAERLRRTVRDPIAVDATLVHIDATIGIALADGSTVIDNPEVLVRRADQAMYQAKQPGPGPDRHRRTPGPDTGGPPPPGADRHRPTAHAGTAPVAAGLVPDGAGGAGEPTRPEPPRPARPGGTGAGRRRDRRQHRRRRLHPDPRLAGRLPRSQRVADFQADRRPQRRLLQPPERPEPHPGHPRQPAVGASTAHPIDHASPRATATPWPPARAGWEGTLSTPDGRVLAAVPAGHRPALRRRQRRVAGGDRRQAAQRRVRLRGRRRAAQLLRDARDPRRPGPGRAQRQRERPRRPSYSR